VAQFGAVLPARLAEPVTAIRRRRRLVEITGRSGAGSAARALR
jgi:hypothetical protein